jgi:hypothetical protein
MRDDNAGACRKGTAQRESPRIKSKQGSMPRQPSPPKWQCCNVMKIFVAMVFEAV